MKISVVCPYYNESAIIENAIKRMVSNLGALSVDWELILVDDGSTDDSLRLAQGICRGNTKVRLVTYPANQGRGYALKQGIIEAQGDIIVTTEVDLSWGDDIVDKIIRKFQASPLLDVVIASPNLPGGGYRNVPLKRVFVSRLGNIIIRLLFTKGVTMNTGMTRGYRKGAIKGLPVFERGKEFHLEVLLKLMALGYRIGEVPATLEWKAERLVKRKGGPSRKSSSNIPRLVVSHLNFVVFANPIRYFWALALVCALVGLSFIADAFYRLFAGDVAIYAAIIGISMVIVALLFFGFGIISNQNNFILRELWRVQKKENEGTR